MELVEDLGGIEYATERAKSFAGEAEEALRALPPGPAVEALRDSITYVVDRNR
jgi:geranylgeranyl pyrophosphate synthase